MKLPLKLILFLLLVYVPIACLDYQHFPFSDAPEHGAAVMEMSKNLAHPGEPMLSEYTGKSSRYVPSCLVMAVAKRLLGADILVVLKLFLPIGFAFFLLAAALFAREYFNDDRQAAWSLLCLLFLWGNGWIGANAYMFSALLFTSYFPSLVAFSLAILALTLQLRFMRSGGAGFGAAYMLCGALSFVSHPPTAGFFFIGSGALFLERKVPLRQCALWFGLCAAAALALTALWPYYDFFQNFKRIAAGNMAQALDYGLTRKYLYSSPLLRLGPALAGVPCLLFFLYKRRYVFLSLGFGACLLIYAAGYFFEISLAERFVLFAAFFLQLAVSRLGRESAMPAAGGKRLTQKAAAAALVLLLGSGLCVQAGLVFSEFLRPALALKPAFPFVQYSSPNAHYLGLRRYLHEGDVVLSEIYSSWPIPVYTGAKIVALMHSPPHVPDNSERYKETERFYHAGPDRQIKLQIIRKYRVTHVYLDYRVFGSQIDPHLRAMGARSVVRTPRYEIFDVRHLW